MAKNHNLGHILTSGDSFTDPPLPRRVKFGVPEQTQGVYLPAKVYMNVFIVSASGGKKQFLANFDISGAHVPTPRYRRGPNLVCYSRRMAYAYVPNFVSISLFCRNLLAKNPIFAVLLNFGIQWCLHLVGV